MQQDLKQSRGNWRPLQKPSDFIQMEIGETIVIRYVSSEKSEVYEKNHIHTVDLNVKNVGDPELQKMSGKDLDNWFLNSEDIEPGVVLRVKRIEDKKIPNKPKPLHRYEKEIWEAK